VAPTGRDLWRLAETLDVPIWAFTVYTDAPADAADAFALDTSDRRFRVVLAKRPDEELGEQESAPCVFLWRLRDGHAQCGLGGLRPMVCQTYPSILQDGLLCMGESSGCSCHAWALSHLDGEQETRLLERLAGERAEYAAVLRAWNARIAQTFVGRAPDYVEFCDYLTAAYAEHHHDLAG